MTTCRRGTTNCAFFEEAARLLPAGATEFYMRWTRQTISRIF
jgi:hypothetical protein